MHRFLLAAAVAALLSTQAEAFQHASASGPDWDAAKKESEARKAAADARKAEAEAETAATKAQFGTLADYSREGNTTVGDKAGQLESAMLSAESTRRLGNLIVRDVCIRDPSLCVAQTSVAVLAIAAKEPPAPGPSAVAPVPSPTGLCGEMVDPTPGTTKLYVVSETQTLTFDTADQVQASLCGAQRKLQRGIAMSEQLKSGGQALAVLSGALTALSIAGNLLRSDYSVQGVTVATDDLLLAKAVVNAGQGRIVVPVMIPAVYRPAALTTGNPLLVSIGALDQLREQAATLAAGHKSKAAALTKRGKKVAGVAKVNSDVAAELEAAVKAYDDYLTKIATPSDKGVSELAEAARQARMRSDLANGSRLLTLKMNAAGGTTYSKKNFFATMFGIPFYVSGGTVASFTLIDGQTGTVLGAGDYSSSAGFEQIQKFHSRRARQ